MFILTILEKKKKTNEYKIFSRKCNSIIKDDKLSKKSVKLTNTQLKKLKSATKMRQEQY